MICAPSNVEMPKFNLTEEKEKNPSNVDLNIV